MLSKLLTALRRVITETGEAKGKGDSQEILTLEQEIKDAQLSLALAKEHLIEVIAEQMAVQRQVNNLKSTVAQHELYALQALEKSDENMTKEVSDKIAAATMDLETHNVILESFNENISGLKQIISSIEQSTQGLEQGLTLIKTLKNVNDADAELAEKFSSSRSSLKAAMESLERIKTKRNDDTTG